MKKYFRNYAHDMPKMYRDVYTAMCDCFDKYQKDFDGVDERTMITYIMKYTRGSVNPMLLNEILKEFEK